MRLHEQTPSAPALSFSFRLLSFKAEATHPFYTPKPARHCRNYELLDPLKPNGQARQTAPSPTAFPTTTRLRASLVSTSQPQ